MIHIVVFFVLLALTCGYAMYAGGQPERLASLILLLGVVATFLLPFDPVTSFHTVETAEMIIDLAVFAGFVGIAAAANRFWPMWLAALHLVGLGVHGVKGYQSDLLPVIYAAASGKIGYGLILILAVAVYRHHSRVATTGQELDWSIAREANS